MSPAPTLAKQEWPWEGREVLLATLEELGLPQRVINAGPALGCTLVGQLIQKTKADLLRVPYMGLKSVGDALAVLESHTLSLGMVLPGWDDTAAFIHRKRLRGLLSQALGAPDARLVKAEVLEREILLTSVQELGLPQRIINAAPEMGCNLVGQLVQKTEAELLSFPHMGRKSVSDAAKILSRYSLRFGMHLRDWDDGEASQERDLLLQRRAEETLPEGDLFPEDVDDIILLASFDELRLPQRFLSALPRVGGQLIGQLVQMTEAELLRLPNMGRTSVATAKETLAKYSLRFGMKLSGWDLKAALRERQRLGRDLIRQIHERSGVQDESAPTLEEEVERLFMRVESGRNIGMLLSLHGFDGSPPKTLDAVGRVHQLTRERVRQISDRARRRALREWHPTPKLAAALRCFEELEPCSAAKFSKALAERGITRTIVHPEALLEFAPFVDRELDIKRIVVGGQDVFASFSNHQLVTDTVKELRRATSAMGCTSVERLAIIAGQQLECAECIRRFLADLPETVWLGPGQAWVMSSKPTRNRLVNYAEKVFLVTEKISLPELRHSLARPHRVESVPPQDALGDLMEVSGLARRAGDYMERARTIPTERLGSIEKTFWDAFLKFGSPLSREQLEDFCIDECGVNPTSFWIYLSYTAILNRLATGVYALAGSAVTPGAVEEIRATTLAGRVPAEHGWTPDGRLWCVVQLNRITARVGTRNLPTYVLGLTAGEWQCVVPGGLPAGAAKVDSVFISGLKTAFSLLGAEGDDFARLTFDLGSRTLDIRIGGSQLADEAPTTTYPEEVEDEDGEEADELD